MVVSVSLICYLCGHHFTTVTAFRCSNGDFYVALGSSIGLELLVLVGGGLLKRVLYYFGSGQKSPMPHLTRLLLVVVSTVQC